MNKSGLAQGQLEHAVTELLQERGQLLSRFCELAGAEGADEAERERLLRRFCQVLVDYLSLWRFEVEALLLDPARGGGRAREALSGLQPLLDQTSDVSLEFNDRYDASDHPLDLSRLDHHLSKLGETLARRFDAEDRVISSI